MGVRAVAASVTLLTSSSALAAGLDVDGWLEKPGVKLLAVEFYATWCKPCMEAVPKWKALHEKYRKQGLRLVVVSTQDPGGVCANPGWTPDEVVCDLDGVVAERYGAGSLPAAFLWGWQGHQLVARAHVEDVEAAIESWMREAPRVDVSVGGVPKGVKVSGDELRKVVVDELGRSGKLVVVASAAERKKLAELKRRQFEAGYDEKAICELGKELPANSMLEASVLGDSVRPKLALQLHSAESGCLSASALTELDPDHSDRAVAEALDTLIRKTRTETQLPGGGTPRKQEAPKRAFSSKIEEQRAAWSPESSNEVIVSFSSSPGAAVVLVDGDVLCQSTPCKKSLGRGPHSVVMQKERYEKRSERVAVAPGTKLEWKLEAAFGTLSVSSEPSGLAVYVDGERVGESPVSSHELDPGAHEVWVEDRCYLKKGERFGLAKGESKQLSFAPAARESAVEVKAEDGDGDAVEAKVLVDGKEVGATPGTWKVALCSEKVEVRSSEGSFEETLKLEERKTSKVKATLGSRARASAVAQPKGPTPALPASEKVDPSDLVTFRFEVTPAEATISIDGQAVSGNEARVPQSQGDHVVDVSAPGFLPQQHSLSARLSARLRVELEPRPKGWVSDRAAGRASSGGAKGDMVTVPAGEFWMGCSPKDSSCGDDAKPGRKVYLDAFSIDRTEVTVGRYNACVRAGNCRAAYDNDRGDDHPVVGVAWNEASVFCKWAGGALPTEAQWEKAARGTDGRIYPWGDQAPSCEHANMIRCGGSIERVGSKPAGANGLFDMAGNVWEWVEDVYDPNAYRSLGARNPVSRSGRSRARVVRGGSWSLEFGGYVSTSVRGGTDLQSQSGAIGFRCARPSS